MILTEFSGYSGSRVQLIRENNRIFVRKQGSVHRNFERLTALEKQGYPVCRVLDYHGDTLDVEYIHGIDMLNYLKRNSINDLKDFFIDVFKSFRNNQTTYDYESVYRSKFATIDFSCLPFDQEDLVNRLPKVLPQTEYHGDLTLENIIYHKTRGFVLIDAVTIEYNSYCFDLAKLRQDTVAKWFLRNTQLNLDFKLQHLNQALDQHLEPTSNELIIAMLLRVYRHAQNDEPIKLFLEQRMRSLWK